MVRILLVLIAFLGALPAGAQTPQPSFFNTVEVARAGLTPFPKWTGALQRYLEERSRTAGDCTARAFNRCHWQEWQKLIADAAALPRRAQLDAVNRFMNRAKYITDPVNWHLDDYWTSLGEFFAKEGDCEDYAIAKFLTLRQIGWPGDQLRVAIVQDMNLRVPHAVLIATLDGVQYVLDNQVPQVVEQGTIRHYRPIFSLNESAWWMHRPRT